MRSIRLRCAAKINLSLDVTGRRPDGYHDLESIFQTVGVYDVLSVSVGEGGGITLCCDTPGVPCDERNLAWRAANAFLQASGAACSVHIALEKHIPSGAGMGGGSADAAAVLYALNLLLDCGYSNETLREIGTPLGADVPFLLLGGTAYAEGIGEKLTALPTLPALPLVLLKGTQSISTPAAYRAIDALEDPPHPATGQVLEAIRTQNIPLLAMSCGNLFEEVSDCEDVRRAKQTLLEAGARCAVMTGSGSAVFGIFDSMEAASRCAEQAAEAFDFAKACTTVAEPFIVL